MCTATWFFEDQDRYELFFSRDESRARRPASEPSLHVLNGMPYLAPTDKEKGGTWIGVNEAGVALCLLNLYGPRVPAPDEGKVSRGTLLGSLMDVQRLSELASRIGRATLRDYNPFLLLGLAPRAVPVCYRWDGKSVSMSELKSSDMPVTSSSHATARVLKHRRQLLDRMRSGSDRLTSETLLAFHRGAGEKDRAVSVCMSRPDAHTVSFSHIRVTPERNVFAYSRVVADEARFLDPVTSDLPRQRDPIPSHIRSASEL